MRGPHGKLWTEFFSFLLWPKREARGPWKQGRNERGSITCPTDWANEANKMFITWLCWLFRFWNGDRELEVRTATYGPGIDQSQHAKSLSHIIKQDIKHYNADSSRITTNYRRYIMILSYFLQIVLRKRGSFNERTFGWFKVYPKKF